MDSRKKVEISVTRDPNAAAEAELIVDIAGETSLIEHAWTPKAALIMLQKQMGEDISELPPKEPIKDAIDCAYWIGPKPKPKELRFKAEQLDFPIYLKNPGGKLKVGFPAGGVKKAIVRGSSICGSVMTESTTRFWVQADDKENGNILIQFKSWAIRQDHVRIGQGKTDLRHRCMFIDWSATLHINFNSLLLKAEMLTAWIRQAGKAVGIGEWRPFPSKTGAGPFGTWKVIKAVALIPKTEEIKEKAA